MNFEYSSFISYRQNDGDKKFLRKFKKIIESEAFLVTNIKDVFFDNSSIGWGNEFDEKIYNSIAASYFFIPIYHIGYLHVDDIWCARELYHALEVEKVIRNKVNSNDYCFILPIIYRGQLNALPGCINKKNAKKIRKLETAILNNKSPERLNKFRRFLYTTFKTSVGLLSDNNINLVELCADIYIPTDEEIKKWIKEQKEIIRSVESKKLPILKKHAE